MKKKDYMDIDSSEAMAEMKKLRHTLSPLTAMYLIMDYTTDELETSISKIEFVTMSRLDARYKLAETYLDRHWLKMIHIGEPESAASIRLKKTFTIQEAAEQIGVSYGTISNAIKNGRLKYNDVTGQGNRLHARISQKDIDEYIKHKKNK